MKMEMEDKSVIKTVNEKVTRPTEKEQHLKQLEVNKSKVEEDLKKMEIDDKSKIEAMKEEVGTLENQHPSSSLLLPWHASPAMKAPHLLC